jgi:pyrroloquinoline quinone biosynthesis protein B
MNGDDVGVTAVILGIMQDGGLPHIGCQCARCAAAQVDPGLERYAAGLALIDWRGAAPMVWLIDATPDIRRQLALMVRALGPHPRRRERVRQPDGLFLTHAHMGHIGGLPQFGPEAMAVTGLPVYGTAGLISLLSKATLWRPVVSALTLKVMEPDTPLLLGEALTITALPVPHRDELQVGTLAYRIDGPRRSLLYVPDIDAWHLWPQATGQISAVDVALLDASFYSDVELEGRAPVAHPLVPETLYHFSELPARLILTHINHTNPILDIGSPEREMVRRAGAEVATQGLVIPL